MLTKSNPFYVIVKFEDSLALCNNDPAIWGVIPYCIKNRQVQPVPIFHWEDPYAWWRESLSPSVYLAGQSTRL